MEMYRVITTSDMDVAVYCGRLFSENGERVRVEVFESSMRKRFGFVPGIELSGEDAENFNSVDHYRLLVKDGFICKGF